MRNRPQDPDIPDQERASTGIPGLDHILGGGLPTNHLYLIEGTPGAGKTTLGLQFLRQGVEKGEPGLYITLSETAAELRTVAASHGWTDRRADSDDLQLHSIAHGVISLEPTVGQCGPEQRNLRVIKMRGIRYPGGDHDFNLGTGSLLKAVSVVKSRTTDHELTIREFRLGASGMQVGEALTDFEGVLTGVASYNGELPLLAGAGSAGAA